MEHLYIDNWFKKPPLKKGENKIINKKTVCKSKKGTKNNAKLRQKTKK